MFGRELSTHWIIAVRNSFNTMTTGLPFFFLMSMLHGQGVQRIRQYYDNGDRDV